jgi:branched-chain amino acid transport system substrate-binding protein
MLLAAQLSCQRAHGGGPTEGGSRRVGIVTALSGTQAAFGQAHQRGYAIALDEINAEGGVLGRPLELDTADDASTAEGAAQAARKLVDEDHVPVVIGSYASESSLALVAEMTRRNVPLVVPTSTADDIIQLKSPWVFRLCAGSSDYADAVVNFLQNHGAPRTIAIVYDNAAFGQAHDLAMRKAGTEAGIRIVDEEAYTAGTAPYLSLLQRVKEKRPDVIYFASYLLDATALMHESREIDLNARFFAAAGTGFSAAEFPTANQGAGKDAEYTIAASQWVPQVTWPGAKEFDGKFVAKYGVHPSYHAAQAYAALRVVAAAMNRANDPDPTAIRGALKRIHLGSAFGPVHFAENGQNEHPVVVTQVQRGEYVVVWPRDLAAAPVLETAPWAAR